MNKEIFDRLSRNNQVQPNYPEYSSEGFRILTINHREGLIEINEKRMWHDTTWYRYENLSIVKFSKMEENK